MSKQIDLNIAEAKDFIKHIITNNQYLQTIGEVPTSVEIISNAGIGKTSIVQQVAEELKLDFVKLSLSQIEELGDLVGFPLRQFQMCKDGNDCLWIDEPAINTYEKEGFKFTGEKRMSYCPPEWIAGKTEGGILLIDDYTRGDIRFLQATMELISKQEYISWKLPKNWHILLTSNPSDGDYLVNEIDDAMKTRFISIGLKFDVQEWAKYAESRGLDGRCINFLLLNPEVINKKVNPRSITTFFNSISSIKDFENNLSIIQMIGEGSIGVEATGLFVSFINNKLDKLLAPKDIMNKSFDAMKIEMQNLIGSSNLGTYRADIASVLSTRVINYSNEFAKDNKIEKTYIDRIEELVLNDLFGPDLSYHLVKTIFSCNQKFKLLTLRQDLTKYIIN